MEEPDFGQESVDTSLTITKVGEYKDTCNTCDISFDSKNLLHQHIEEAGHAAPVQALFGEDMRSKNTFTTDVLIESSAKAVEGTGYAFRGWQYATCDISFSRYGEKKKICLDTVWGIRFS